MLALQDPDCFYSVCWTEQTPSGGQLNICQLHSSLIKNGNVRNNVYSSPLHDWIKYQQFAYIVYSFSRGAWPFLSSSPQRGLTASAQHIAKRGISFGDFCNTTNSAAADEFATFSWPRAYRSQRRDAPRLYRAVKLSPISLTLSLTLKCLRAYRDSWLHCSFFPRFFWLEHRNYYIVLGNALSGYQAKTNHCDLLAWTHVVIRFSWNYCLREQNIWFWFKSTSNEKPTTTPVKSTIALVQLFQVVNNFNFFFFFFLKILNCCISMLKCWMVPSPWMLGLRTSYRNSPQAFANSESHSLTISFDSGYFPQEQMCCYDIFFIFTQQIRQHTYLLSEA